MIGGAIYFVINDETMPDMLFAPVRTDYAKRIFVHLAFN